MRIKLTSILVDDQDKGLRFYTEVLRKAFHSPPSRWRTSRASSPD